MKDKQEIEAVDRGSFEFTFLDKKKSGLAKFLAVLCAVLVINNIIFFTPSFGVLYYAILVIVLMFLFFNAGNVKINMGMILLYIAGVYRLSALRNRIKESLYSSTFLFLCV